MSDNIESTTAPTWDEFARVKRQRDAARADLTVVKEELDSTLADYAALESKCDVFERHSKDRAKLNQLMRDINEKLATSEHRVQELERENGRLEANLARAAGRVVVVAPTAQTEIVVNALIQIRDLVEPYTRKNSRHGEDFWEVPNTPADARCRQLHSIVKRALEESGAVTKSAAEAEAIRAKFKL
jgi:chromosome segregation ATPase